jgi:AcrR family transcriptional regulator
LRQIADAADMKAGSIYYYFDSKGAILDAVFDIGIRAVFDAVRQKVDSLAPNTSWRQKIEAAISAHLDALLRLGDFASANIRIYGQSPALIRARNQKLRRAYANYWNALLSEARDAGEIRRDTDLSLVRLLLISALNWTVEWYGSERGPVEPLAKTALVMLFDGISKER